MKRLNPRTNEPFKSGDIREDGKVFRSYQKTTIKRDGYYKESWLSPAAYLEQLKSQSASGKKWRNARYVENKAMVDGLKLEKGCVLCGYKEHPSALDFDHIVPSEKKFNISSRVGSLSKNEILKEIKKCRVLCANCHRIHSSGQVENSKKWVAVGRVSDKRIEKRCIQGMPAAPLWIGNRSGVSGVSWHNGTASWEARINISGKRYNLGRTKDFFEAVCKRRAAELRLSGT